MRSVQVSVWKGLDWGKENQAPLFLLDCVTLFISLVAKSCHELYRTTVRKVHGAPSRCCISTVPAEVSLGRFGGADSIFSKSSRCPGVGRKTETTSTDPLLLLSPPSQLAIPLSHSSPTSHSSNVPP